MGLFLQQNDGRSKLQSRLAEELREKVKTAQRSDITGPDVEPELLSEGRQTRPAGMLIAVLVLIVIVVIGIIIAMNL